MTYSIENNYEIIFDNGGGATFQTSDYCHHYSDMKQLATDVASFLESDDTSDWEGNEPGHFVSDEDYRVAAENGGLKCVTDWKDAKDTGWLNERDFLWEMVRLLPEADIA